MEGSTRPGPLLPGLSKKVKVLPRQNQILPPAMYGIVTVVVVPGAPRAMEQFVDSFVPLEEGFDG